MFSIIGVPEFDYIGKRRIAFLFSGVLMALGLFALVMIWTGNGNLGIDFAGGIAIQGHFEKPVPIEQIRSVLAREFDDIEINEVKDFSFPNAFIIKTKITDDQGQGLQHADRINEIFATEFPDNGFTKDSEDVVGSAVGDQLAKDARLAILLSIAGILAYIAFRFDFRSGVAATVAIVHDVLAVVGIFFIFHLEFDLLIVSALLTLAGYSLTDSVVVYDRIRENLRKYRTKGQFMQCINRSINETLSRTINTAATVLFVVILLYIGGGPLRSFALALILGVIVGTYSSIFVASPIIYEWEQHRPTKFNK